MNVLAPCAEYCGVYFTPPHLLPQQRMEVTAEDLLTHPPREEVPLVIYRPRRRVYRVRRKIIVRGRVVAWETEVAHGRRRSPRSREEARAIAAQIAAGLQRLTRAEFIEWVIQGRSKRTTHEIISAWSCFENAEIDEGELAQMGIFTLP